MGSAKEISDPSDDGIRFNDDPFFNHGKDATFFFTIVSSGPPPPPGQHPS